MWGDYRCVTLISERVFTPPKYKSEMKEDLFMKEVCVWSIEEGSFSYDTGCGGSYNPYVNCPDVYPPIIDDKCPFCGKKIKYVKNK